MAESIARYLGVLDTPAYVHVLGSELQSEHDSSKVSGSAPGLVGAENETMYTKLKSAKLFADATGKHCFPVVFIDEAHKIHPTVQNLVREFIYTGRISSASAGGHMDFGKQFLVIQATNWADEAIQAEWKRSRTSSADSVHDLSKWQDLITQAMKENNLEGATVGRAGTLIPFLPLSEDDAVSALVKMAQRQTASYPRKQVNVDSSFLRWMYQQHYNENLGLRPLFEDKIRGVLTTILRPTGKWVGVSREMMVAIRWKQNNHSDSSPSQTRVAEAVAMSSSLSLADEEVINSYDFSGPSLMSLRFSAAAPSDSEAAHSLLPETQPIRVEVGSAKRPGSLRHEGSGRFSCLQHPVLQAEGTMPNTAFVLPGRSWLRQHNPTTTSQIAACEILFTKLRAMLRRKYLNQAIILKEPSQLNQLRAWCPVDVPSLCRHINLYPQGVSVTMLQKLLDQFASLPLSYSEAGDKAKKGSKRPQDGQSEESLAGEESKRKKAKIIDEDDVEEKDAESGDEYESICDNNDTVYNVYSTDSSDSDCDLQIDELDNDDNNERESMIQDTAASSSSSSSSSSSDSFKADGLQSSDSTLQTRLQLQQEMSHRIDDFKQPLDIAPGISERCLRRSVLASLRIGNDILPKEQRVEKVTGTVIKMLGRDGLQSMVDCMRYASHDLHIPAHVFMQGEMAQRRYRLMQPISASRIKQASSECFDSYSASDRENYWQLMG